MHVDVMSEKHWCHKCMSHVWKRRPIKLVIKYILHSNVINSCYTILFILLRTKYVPSLVKIHWRMLILECSQGCYGRTDGSVTISLINVDVMSAMHITNIDVMSEKHWCHQCRCHVWKTLMSLMYVSYLKKTTNPISYKVHFAFQCD
jgi:hypothetical protein